MCPCASTHNASPERHGNVTAFIGGTPAHASAAKLAMKIGSDTPTMIGSASFSEHSSSRRTSRVRSRRTG